MVAKPEKFSGSGGRYRQVLRQTWMEIGSPRMNICCFSSGRVKHASPNFLDFIVEFVNLRFWLDSDSCSKMFTYNQLIFFDFACQYTVPIPLHEAIARE